jgi:hypothetical protein
MNMRIPGGDSRCLALRAAIMLTLLLQACAPLPRLGPVPEVQTEQAAVPGMPDSRIWMDRDLTAFVKVVIEDNARELSALLQAGRHGSAWRKTPPGESDVTPWRQTVGSPPY